MAKAKIKVYQYPKCSTCVKALKFLKTVGADVEAIDITTTPPSKTELKKMLKAKGDRKALFNTSGVQYRELKISERLQEMSDDEALELLAGNGRLIKRPFLLDGEVALIGFKEPDWKKAFA